MPVVECNTMSDLAGRGFEFMTSRLPYTVLHGGTCKINFFNSL